jgi:murein DD-endopeptidase MepM/ murein hydrolase activator NlpD
MDCMRFIRALLVLLLLAGAILGAVYYAAGRAAPPTIAINQPTVIGQTGTLDVTVDAPGGNVSQLTVELQQKGRTVSLFALDSTNAASLKPEGPDRVRLTQPLGKHNVPQLESGSLTLTATASRPVLRGLRTVSARTTREVTVRLEPPRISVMSTHHYINQGGSEMVVYRVTPPDVMSGVAVGDRTYPGFPAAGAGIQADPSVRLAFFALLYDQPVDAPIELVARDVAGNEARAAFEHRVFPKAFKRSRINIDDAFLGRVVPSILKATPSFISPPPTADDLLPAFVKINGELRRMNADQIAALAERTSPNMLWKGAFQRLGGSQVESAFADFRTYIYRGQEVDQQVHLGFDLAKTANVPLGAANRGKVLYAADLGIYGNCVILDHGMGVQSLYGHLSSFDVHAGEDVDAGQTIGRSGQTGLAGGDHLHFSMLVNGQFVNATEWWDPHWIEDRVTRKLREIGATDSMPTDRR